MGGGSFKYLIPGIIAVILLSGVLLSNKFITKQSLGSIYNIDEAGTNFDNVKIGDEINYEINGYSDWQVIGKNEYTGTIDIVSKTNTEDLILEPNQTKEDYERIFQETANKYVDNNYVISARTVNSNDLDYFNYDNDFWINNINETHIITPQSTWQYEQSNVEPNYKMYIVPLIRKVFDNMTAYNNGDIVDYSNHGINRWVVYEKDPYCLNIIPETPIEITINSKYEDINEKANQIISSFDNDVSSVERFDSNHNIEELINIIPNFFNQQRERIYFYDGAYFFTDNDKIKFAYKTLKYYENGEFGEFGGGCYSSNCAATIYTEKGPKTLGYRPVVTLKVKKEIQDTDKKEVSSKLQVGDNVKYEAKGYKNWKVLSIDKELGTVDIISGGIVKNITLSGKDDWDNYEDIIQREVDEYKNGEQAEKATTVTSTHLKTLKDIDKSALSRYWLLTKSSYILSSLNAYGGVADIINYSIGSIYLYKYDSYEMKIDDITIYTGVSGEGPSYDYYNINARMVYTYTAGLRPVITLKLDSIEKLPEEETKKIEESTEKQEKVFIKEQESKNKDYKGPSKVDDSTSSTGNNEVKTNDNDNIKDNITDSSTSNVEKIVYKDKPFYKYGFIIATILCIIEPVITILIYKKIKER